MICSLHKQTRSCVQLDTHTYTPIREKRQDEKENSRYQDYLLFRYLFFLKSRATAFNNETLVYKIMFHYYTLMHYFTLIFLYLFLLSSPPFLPHFHCCPPSWLPPHRPSSAFMFYVCVLTH